MDQAGAAKAASGKGETMNAYLVVLDEDGEYTFVVLSSDAQGAAAEASRFNHEAENIAVSLLCDADHVLGLDHLNRERKA